MAVNIERSNSTANGVGKGLLVLIIDCPLKEFIGHYALTCGAGDLVVLDSGALLSYSDAKATSVAVLGKHDTLILKNKVDN